MENVTVLIRSVRERTEALCRKLVLEQDIPESELFMVREVPFSETLRSCYKKGIDRGKTWTLCVDADVLPRPGSIRKMVQLAEAQEKRVSEVQGFIMDKFFGGPRKGGFHLYRTSLLPMALEQLQALNEQIRPETATLNRMAQKGHPRAVVPYIVGTHDDEQYNFDIYRKAFVHAVKHLDMAELLVNHWKKNIDNDPDFNVALKAFSDSILSEETATINREQELYQKMFEKSGLSEKSELEISEISLEDVEKRIQSWHIDELYYSYFPDSGGLDSGSTVAIRKLKTSLKNRGVSQTVLLSLSQALVKAGEKLGSRVPV